MLLLLLFCVGGVLGSTAVPLSPCPGVFRYRQRGDRWTGLVRVPEREETLVTVTVLLPEHAIQHNRGGLKPSPSYSSGSPGSRSTVALDLELPSQDPLPLLFKVTLDNELLCRGKPVKGMVERTFYFIQGRSSLHVNDHNKPFERSSELRSSKQTGADVRRVSSRKVAESVNNNRLHDITNNRVGLVSGSGQDCEREDSENKHDDDKMTGDSEENSQSTPPVSLDMMIGNMIEDRAQDYENEIDIGEEDLGWGRYSSNMTSPSTSADDQMLHEGKFTTPPATQVTSLATVATPPATPVTSLPTVATPPTTPVTSLPTVATPPATLVTSLPTVATPPATPVTSLPTVATPPATPVTSLPTVATPPVTPVTSLPTVATPPVTPATLLPTNATQKPDMQSLKEAMEAVRLLPHRAVVQPGDDVTFLARTGVPLRLCEFYLPGGPVRRRVIFRRRHLADPSNNEYDYFGASLQNGDCGIRLKYVSDSLDGVLECRVTLAKKVMSLTFASIIRVSDFGENELPSFEISPRKATVHVEDELVITCNTDPPTPLEVCLFHLPGSKVLDLSKGRRSRQSDEYHYHGVGLQKGECGLKLMPFDKRYAGYITCKAGSMPLDVDGLWNMDVMHLTIKDAVGFSSRIYEPVYKPTRKVQCGISVRHASLIYGGMFTERGEWPWLVPLYVEQNMNFLCASTLINKKHVITAAHCIKPPPKGVAYKKEELVLILGKFNIWKWAERKVQPREIEQIFIHPDYNHENLRADIAVLEMNIPADYNAVVKPICMWDSDKRLDLIVNHKAVISKSAPRNSTSEQSKPDTHAGISTTSSTEKEGPQPQSTIRQSRDRVVGWGRRENMEKSASPLRAEVPIVSQQTCIDSHDGLRNYVNHRTLCGGYRNGTGPCMGDSGGGLYLPREKDGVMHWYLRGVVSLSLRGIRKVCGLNNYNVYTDVAQYSTWLAQFQREE